MRLRFAPSPTGYVHVGNARTALFNYLHAARTKGSLVLRIEDTDVERSKREYEENLMRDMKWLGIEWQEGTDVEGEFGPYRQSERTEIYKDHAQKLIDSGHAYYCFCTPEELQKQKEEAKKEGGAQEYSGKCRDLDIDESKKRIEAGEAAAVRFKIPADSEAVFYDLVRDKVAFDTNLLGDPVILRSTGMPAYNFSVVVDDALMGITLVIRGEDHISNTARQIMIYQALGFKPPKFAHLSMVMGEDNAKLSKRHGSTSIFQFREEGYLPQALLNYLALLGWAPPGGKKEIMTKEELIKNFNIKKVSKSAAIFDYQKLKWMNREHFRMLKPTEMAHIMIPFLKDAGFSFPEDDKEVIKWIAKGAKVLSNYHYLLPEIAEGFKEFTTLDYDPEFVKTFKKNEDHMTVLAFLADEVRNVYPPFDFTVVQEASKKLKMYEGMSGRAVYHPLRLALTGKESGIELKDIIPLIEKGAALDIEPQVQNIQMRLKVFYS